MGEGSPSIWRNFIGHTVLAILVMPVLLFAFHNCSSNIVQESAVAADLSHNSPASE